MKEIIKIFIKMKKILLFTGTDALTLIKNPLGNKIWHIKLIFYRLKWKMLKNFFDEIWTNHPHLINYLNKFGIKVNKVYETELLYSSNYGKEKHNGVNILYYCPERPVNLGGMKFIHWIYGYDVFQMLMLYYSLRNRKIRFIRVTGNDDMSKIYPIIDLYIRPTRHDGLPRMSRECEINNIPVIESEDFEPTFIYFKIKIDEKMANKKVKRPTLGSIPI